MEIRVDNGQRRSCRIRSSKSPNLYGDHTLHHTFSHFDNALATVSAYLQVKFVDYFPSGADNESIQPLI